MIKIAICDNDSIFLKQMYQMTSIYLRRKSKPFETRLFLSGKTLVHSMELGAKYDLALIDIKIDKMNKIDTGAILRERFNHTETLLICISASDLLAKDVPYYNAVRFLSKPVDPFLFEEALCHACQLLEKIENETFSFKDQTKQLVTLPLRTIIYFETHTNHKLSVITAAKRYIYYGKMLDMENGFSESGFLRIHQSYLINCNQIKQIDYNKVVMKNDAQLYISRERRKKVQNQYLQIRQKLYYKSPQTF